MIINALKQESMMKSVLNYAASFLKFLGRLMSSNNPRIVINVYRISNSILMEEDMS